MAKAKRIDLSNEEETTVFPDFKPEWPNKYGQVGYVLAHTTFQSIGGASPSFEGIALAGFRDAKGPKVVLSISEYEHQFIIEHPKGKFGIPKSNCRGWEYVGE